MACPCNNPIIVTPKPSCKDCIIAKTVRYTCDDSPNPCGEEVTIDLSDINNIDICTNNCGATYSIKKYDEEGFDEVSITSNGVLTYTTSDVFEKQKEYEITYKIQCGCGSPQLSTTAKVIVCRKDLCKNAPKGAACNHCNGDFLLAKDHTIYKHQSLLSKCAGTQTVQLEDYINTSFETPITYALVSATSGLTSVTIDTETGELEFSKLGESYDTQKIVWAATTNGYTSQATLTIEIKNLCQGVTCTTGYQCDECTGECEESIVDLEISF